MKNMSRKSNRNFAPYFSMVRNFISFYAIFLMLTARNHFLLVHGVSFKTIS